MSNFYVAVKDNEYITVMNYLPNIPEGVELYDITEEDYNNYVDKGYKFNLTTKKIETVDESIILERSWVDLRDTRNKLLSNSDWIMLSDNTLTEEQKNNWKTYRQALRDLPQNTTDPREVVWPSKPAQ
jgi:hypothetical protein